METQAINNFSEQPPNLSEITACNHGYMAPIYLQEFLDFCIPGHSLRSGNMQLLKTQPYNQVQDIFYMCPPALDCPSTELRMCDSVGIFKKGLKTFLFRKASC